MIDNGTQRIVAFGLGDPISLHFLTALATWRRSERC